ncbi:hypothetical protein CB1_000345012 [Camelus ferus]|nr:hypothetical protein CB1_000345012 [Camelus ferus]
MCADGCTCSSRYAVGFITPHAVPASTALLGQRLQLDTDVGAGEGSQRSGSTNFHVETTKDHVSGHLHQVWRKLHFPYL